jgi:hypothetical protein
MKAKEMLGFLGYLFEKLEYLKDCDNTHKITKEAVNDSFPDDPEKIDEAMQWLTDHGGCCCDCEIIMNIVGYEQGLLAKLWYEIDCRDKNPAKLILIEKLFCLAEKKQSFG